MIIGKYTNENQNHSARFIASPQKIAIIGAGISGAQMAHLLKRDNHHITIFEMNDVEVPEAWSQVATDILAQKYFRRTGVPQPDGTTGREQSVKQVVHRLADCWTQWGKKANYFASDEDAQIFYDEAVYIDRKSVV